MRKEMLRLAALAPAVAIVCSELDWSRELIFPSTNDLVHRSVVDELRAPHSRNIPDAELLKQLPDFLHDVPDVVRMEPESSVQNSNGPAHPRDVILVNGLRINPQVLYWMMRSTTEVFGRPVVAVVNDEEPALDDAAEAGKVRSLAHSFLGLFSSDLGAKVESQAVNTLSVELVDRAVMKNEKVVLIGHSQGAIICGNTLDLLMRDDSPLDAGQKCRLQQNVSIMLIGSGEHRMPNGFVAVQYHLDDDHVADLARSIGTFIDRPGSSPAELVTLPIGGHHYGPHLSRNAEFFIARSNINGEIAGGLVGGRLATSIEHGDLSDYSHQQIIEKMLARGDRDFARVFLAHVHKGKIGNYLVPHLAELETLAK